MIKEKEKNDKRTNNDVQRTTQKTQDWACGAPLNIGSELTLPEG
jgi:hypothetical protein